MRWGMSGGVAAMAAKAGRRGKKEGKEKEKRRRERVLYIFCGVGRRRAGLRA